MIKDLIINNEKYTCQLNESSDVVTISINGKDYLFKNVYLSDGKLFTNYNGKRLAVPVSFSQGTAFCDVAGKSYKVSKFEKSFSKSRVKDQDGLSSPMPGKIIKVCHSTGERVDAGDPIIIMEAMKMEHTLSAPRAGIIEAILTEEGDLVDGGVTLVELGEINDS